MISETTLKMGEEIHTHMSRLEKEKKINEEFMALEVEVEPINYTLDERLPGIFNISMRDDKSGIVIFTL